MSGKNLNNKLYILFNEKTPKEESHSTKSNFEGNQFPFKKANSHEINFNFEDNTPSPIEQIKQKFKFNEKLDCSFKELRILKEPVNNDNFLNKKFNIDIDINKLREENNNNTPEICKYFRTIAFKNENLKKININNINNMNNINNINNINTEIEVYKKIYVKKESKEEKNKEKNLNKEEEQKKISNKRNSLNTIEDKTQTTFEDSQSIEMNK